MGCHDQKTNTMVKARDGCNRTWVHIERGTPAMQMNRRVGNACRGAQSSVLVQSGLNPRETDAWEVASNISNFWRRAV